MGGHPHPPPSPWKVRTCKVLVTNHSVRWEKVDGIITTCCTLLFKQVGSRSHTHTQAREGRQNTPTQQTTLFHVKRLSKFSPVRRHGGVYKLYDRAVQTSATTNYERKRWGKVHVRITGPTPVSCGPVYALNVYSPCCCVRFVHLFRKNVGKQYRYVMTLFGDYQYS